LANPYHVKPGQPLSDNPAFFERFPYALPNMLAVILFVIGIAIGLLFLEVAIRLKYHLFLIADLYRKHLQRKKTDVITDSNWD